MPFDRVVSEIISAPTGNGGSSVGPADFYRILGYKPADVAAATSRTLLGTQIQCAQCHKHPYDNWTQKDFWGHAAFFAGLVPLERAGRQAARIPPGTSSTRRWEQSSSRGFSAAPTLNRGVIAAGNSPSG